MTITVGPLATLSASPRFSKKIYNRWGSEVGDVSEYTVTVSDDKFILTGPHLNIGGPVALLQAINDASQAVLDASEGHADNVR